MAKSFLRLSPILFSIIYNITPNEQLVKFRGDGNVIDRILAKETSKTSAEVVLTFFLFLMKHEDWLDSYILASGADKKAKEKT